ncbi:MAG: sensor histidine kinase [Rickettsiaceae bacterium]
MFHTIKKGFTRGINLSKSLTIFSILSVIVYSYFFFINYSIEYSSNIYQVFNIIGLILSLFLMMNRMQSLKILQFISAAYLIFFLSLILLNTTNNSQWLIYFLICLTVAVITLMNCVNILLVIFLGVLGSYIAITIIKPFGLENFIIGLKYIIPLLFCTIAYAFMLKKYKAQDITSLYFDDKNSKIPFEETYQKSSMKNNNELLGYINHELRSPVHSISNMSQLLYNHWDKLNNEEKKDRANKIAGNAIYLKALVSKLLNFVELNSGKLLYNFDNLNLVQIIDIAIMQTKNLYVDDDDDVQIDFKHNNVDNAQIRGDVNKIEQLIMNLLGNAIKYTKVGKIDVSLMKVNLNDKVYWKCVVRDQGIGIPTDELDKIFQPFMRSKNNKNRKISTGLGLFFCNEIINAHHGRIWAENSSEPAGAKISFIIPIL